MRSLRFRFTIFTIISLVLFSFLLAGLMDRMFHQTLLTSEENRLKGVVYHYISAMDVDRNGRVQIDSSALPEPLQEKGAMSVYVLNEEKETIWSGGNHALIVDTKILPKTGEWVFENDKKNNHIQTLLFGLAWEGELENQEWKYSILVVDSGGIYRHEMKLFRNKFWTWLLIGAFGLVLLQLVLLRWGFRPLRQIADEVEQIQKGKKHKFENMYPTELEPLTSNINSLLRHERGQQMRYQQTLDNLAHALKTPLSALKNLASQSSPSQDIRKDLDEQVSRVKDIVDYQVRKAATVGKSAFMKPISLHEVVDKISRSIQKVYQQKKIEIEMNIPTTATIAMDEGDLYELVGNIVENAAKYGKSKIRISWEEQNVPMLTIEDDGPGFSNEDMLSLIQRGVRQDQRAEGSGIGLSVAYEIITVFGGTLELTKSTALGGASVRIRWA